MSDITVISVSTGIVLAVVCVYFWLMRRVVEVAFQINNGVMDGFRLSEEERIRLLAAVWASYMLGMILVASFGAFALFEIAKVSSGAVLTPSLGAYLALVAGVYPLIGFVRDARRISKRIRTGQYGFGGAESSPK